MNELTKENLKEEAIKAYYQSEQENALKKIKDEQELARQKAEALEELMAKFPGISTEKIGDKLIFDILGYKFVFSKSFSFWSNKNEDWVFNQLYFWGVSWMNEVKNLNDLGKIIIKYTPEEWNKGYKELKEAAK